MAYLNNAAVSHVGMPLNDINWNDIIGNPFGTASCFNAIIFGNANNIVDVKGALAVGGDFESMRGLTLAYGNETDLMDTGYHPEYVRFLVGGNVAMRGPLVVIGHVIAGGDFVAANGSTYMVGKDGDIEQTRRLADLYQSDRGTRYWSPSDRGNHYAVSSYDIPRYIPALRINADVNRFFTDAKNSIVNYHHCLMNLQPNGMVVENYSEWILRGDDPVQNVFFIDVSQNGILDKAIRLEIPAGSLAIIRLKTGDNAYLRSGLWGDQNNVNQTIYVFEDAKDIYMEIPAAIWGSILAPQANFHAHRTGGTVSGNAALASLAVEAGSGFEFHWFQFAGGVECLAEVPIGRDIPEEEQPMQCPPCPECPEQMPCPEQMICPECPEQMPCPQCPEQMPCPQYPEQMPCPQCPEQRPCPEYPEQMICPECLVEPDVIFGCIWGCRCCCNHGWEIKLYQKYAEKMELLCQEKICCCGCFRFEVPFDGFYVLEICSLKVPNTKCKPLLTLKNIGVSNLMIE